MLVDKSILITANKIWYTNSHFPFLEINEKKNKLLQFNNER